MSTPIACPECGQTVWSRWEGGNFTERHFVYTDTGEHDAEDDSHEVMHTEPWVCLGDRHPAPPDIAEQLDALAA